MKKVPYTIYKPFECIVYDTVGMRVTNPYSKDSIMLTPEEIAIYDMLKGAELQQDYKTMRKGVDWFIKNNIKAYNVLLD